MNVRELYTQIQSKQSFLCVGLDTDIQNLPEVVKGSVDPVFEFNKTIIEATHEYAVAYKPNIAFYEAMGPRGWESLARTLEVIPEGIMTIADAKRGDIGNTANLYARTYFETFDFDAVTVSPYMGLDTIEPYLEYKDKWTIILGLTSNPGAADFEMQKLDSGSTLFNYVISQTKELSDRIMYVVGATKSDQIGDIRELAPKNFFLVPGIGAQGGDLEEIYRKGRNEQCGLIVNASRSIIYASSGDDFAEAARHEAEITAAKMKDLLFT